MEQLYDLFGNPIDVGDDVFILMHHHRSSSSCVMGRIVSRTAKQVKIIFLTSHNKGVSGEYVKNPDSIISPKANWEVLHELINKNSNS